LAKWLKKIKNGLDDLKSAYKTNNFKRVNVSSKMVTTMSESHKKKKTTQISPG